MVVRREMSRISLDCRFRKPTYSAARLLAVGAYTGHDGVVPVAGNASRCGRPRPRSSRRIPTPSPPGIGRPRQVGSTPKRAIETDPFLGQYATRASIELWDTTRSRLFESQTC